MQHLGLSARQHAAFERTLAKDHEIRTRVNVLNMDGVFRAGLTPRFVDGQVDVNAKGERTTRTATLQILDPDRTLHFDPDAPSDDVIYRNRKIRIFRDVLVEEMGIGWVEVPLISGPCTKFDRTGSIVDIEVAGPDYDYSARNTWEPMEFEKGEQITDCIKRILRQRCGGPNMRMAIPDLTGKKYRLAKRKVLRRMSRPWLQAKALARSIDRQLYFDGAAVCRMRRVPHGKPLFVFRDGPGGMIVNEPTQAFGGGSPDFYNGVWAVGRVLPGAKKPLEARVFAPRDHALSPHSLSTGGIPHRQVAASQNPGFRSPDGIQEWAVRRLHEHLEDAEQVGWESLVAPHLDPGDRVAARTDEFHIRRNLWAFTIPLLPDGLMSCGFNRKISYGPSRGGPLWVRHPVQTGSMGQNWGVEPAIPGSMGQSWEPRSA